MTVGHLPGGFAAGLRVGRFGNSPERSRCDETADEPSTNLNGCIKLARRVHHPLNFQWHTPVNSTSRGCNHGKGRFGPLKSRLRNALSFTP